MTNKAANRRGRKNPQPRKGAETKNGRKTAIHFVGFLKSHREQAIGASRENEGEKKNDLYWTEKKCEEYISLELVDRSVLIGKLGRE